MNQNDILRIAKKTAKREGFPRRTPIRNFILGLCSNIYIRLLWLGVKLHVVNFHTFQAYGFNRRYYLDDNWKGHSDL